MTSGKLAFRYISSATVAARPVRSRVKDRVLVEFQEDGVAGCTTVLERLLG